MSNAKGRMAQAYTATCFSCTKLTDLGFKYSVVGDLLETYQSSPNSGGYYHPTADYWANGSLKNLWIAQIPSTAYGADGEGRMSTVTPTSGQVLVPSNPSYNVASQLTSVTYGSSDHDDFIFDNNNGQMTQYKLSLGTTPLTLKGDLTWNANGTLKTQQITDQIVTANSQICNYGYDPLARLASANCGTPWSQTFTLDSFGNLSKSGSSSFAAGYLLANGSTNNRIQSLPGVTVTYDASGNLTNDGTHSYTWDGFGKPVTVDTVGLTYDALGRLVEQNRSGSFTQIVYSPTGAKFALMNGATLTKARLPLPGGGVAVYNGSGLQYYEHADWLNTSRLATTPGRAKYFDGVYAPYGEDYGKSGTTNLSFTGQYQDTVLGLYDFLYREYPSVHGRWISPDPAGLAAMDPENPQSWNRYGYVINNPLGLVDPLGLLETTCMSILSWCSDGCPFTDASCPGGRWAPPGAPPPQTPDDYFSSNDKERNKGYAAYAAWISALTLFGVNLNWDMSGPGSVGKDGIKLIDPSTGGLSPEAIKAWGRGKPMLGEIFSALRGGGLPQFAKAQRPALQFAMMTDSSTTLSRGNPRTFSISTTPFLPLICLTPSLHPFEWVQPGKQAVNCDGSGVLPLTLPYLLLR
jgi:RHS repeat-associated protein